MWELSMNPVDGKPNPEKLLELQYDLRKNRFKSKKNPTVISKHESIKWELSQSLGESKRGDKGFGSTGLN